MHEYWQYRAETFGVGDLEELRTLGREAAPCLPEGKLRVLDVGTGPGTVAMAMALLGHEVTGVDLAGGMIRRARENAAALGLDIGFLNTAAGQLPFPDESFDAVVSLNLTWALPEPEETFRQWRRVLRPGGRLLYWDANHYYFYFNETDAKNREALKALAGTVHILHRDKDGKPQQLDYSLCEQTAPDLPLSRFDRPGGWDDRVLPSLGFTILAERIYRPQQLLKYGVARGYYTEFFIAAIRD